MMNGSTHGLPMDGGTSNSQSIRKRNQITNDKNDGVGSTRGSTRNHDGQATNENNLSVNHNLTVISLPLNKKPRTTEYNQYESTSFASSTNLEDSEYSRRFAYRQISSITSSSLVSNNLGDATAQLPPPSPQFLRGVPTIAVPSSLSGYLRHYEFRQETYSMPLFALFASPFAAAIESTSSEEEEENDITKDGGGRGAYKCPLCGKYKKRHVCSMTQPSTRSTRAPTLFEPPTHVVHAKVVSTYYAIPRSEYNEAKQELADIILPLLIKHREASGEELKLFPSAQKAAIMNKFLKDKKLTGHGDVWEKHLWQTAISIARDGKIVWPRINSRALGELSTTYEKTKTAETSAKWCSDSNTGFVSNFKSKEEANTFCQLAFDTKEKKEEFNTYLSKFAEDDPLRVQKALRKMEWASNMSTKEVEKAVKVAFANGAVLKVDASPLFANSAVTLVEKTTNDVKQQPAYKNLSDGDKKNATKIMTSETCHLKVVAESYVKLIGLGLAFIWKWTDDAGNTFTRIFVSVPEELIFEYCQGIAKKLTGDPNKSRNRAPVPTGGWLLADLHNGGNVINMNATIGDKGFFFEANGGKKSIFQELSVTELNDGSIDLFHMAMPDTNVPIQLHQLSLATGRYFGINVNDEMHHVEGGCLEGMLCLDADETMAKYNCEPTSSRERTLLAQGLVKDPSTLCDGDHLFGRNSKYLQGTSGVMGVPHQENIIRGWVEKKIKQWLFPLLVGKYKTGNEMPVSAHNRLA